ncbi:MAG TPA: hypothetical protein VNQ77_03355 [Frankiaceae bacterium]|nr:hypothetical protein [Frankiaceae bacterium]
MPLALRRFMLPATAVVALAAVAAGSRAVVAAPSTTKSATAATTVTPVSTGDRAVFVPVTQKRLLNTTSGARITPTSPRAVKVTGVAGVPADALAVVVNLAAYKPAAAGFLNVYPTGTTRPTGIATVTFVVGQVTENVATVKVGTGGQVNVFASSTSHAIMDIAGYYVSHAHDDRYLLKTQAQGRTAADAFACPSGSLIQAVAADGAATCVQDASGPVQSVGAGLLLDNGVLSAQQGRSASGAFTCGVGEYLRAVAADGAPTCGTDTDTDTDTTYDAGPGLTLDGTTFSADQRRSVQNAFTCAPGTYLRVVAADGTPTCDADANTTYSAGFGLLLSNGVFSAQQGRSAVNAFTCGVGQYLRAAAADGTPTCATDANTTYTAGTGLLMSGTTISADRSAPNAYTCPAGQYLRAIAANGAPTCAADVDTDTDTNTTYTAGSGLTLAGTVFSAAHGPTVVPIRGDQAPATNGTALRSAVNAITDATATKPYVISLAPGTYDLGTNPLSMKPHVSIVGAGRGATVLTGTYTSFSGGLVNLADNATLARLSVTSSHTGTGWVAALWAVGTLSARVVEVTATATQAAGETFGLLAFSGATVTMEDSSMTGDSSSGSGRGMYAATGGTIRARGVDAVGTGASPYALWAYNTGVVDFAHGTAQGALFREGAGTLKVAHSRVDGSPIGSPSCFGTYDSSLAAVAC